MPIDPSKIKPGDTVRVRFQSVAMAASGIAPYEYTTVTHPGIYQGDVYAGSDSIDSRGLTILEHIPAPDWADALVVRDKDGDLWMRQGEQWHEVNSYAQPINDVAGYAPITVVIDADGNPPQPETEWLDADALDKLPTYAIVLPRMSRRPYTKCPDGEWFNIPGGIGVRSERLDPARLLWTPDADR